MALIECNECGRKISDKAEVCIHCGNPIDDIEEDEETLLLRYLNLDGSYML